jgi:GxxExxY protein
MRLHFKKRRLTTEGTEKKYLHSEKGDWNRFAREAEDMIDGLTVCDESLIERTLGCALKVHRQLGPGLLESVYERALMLELASAWIRAKQQVSIRVVYRGEDLGLGFKADVLVEDSLLLELKAVDRLTDVHLAQILRYLKLTNLKRGFLINFNEKLLNRGIKRVSI